MAQLRDFIVHRYEQIDVEILINVVNRRLTDFERFRTEILAYAKSQDTPEQSANRQNS